MIDLDHFRTLLASRRAEAENQLRATTQDSEPVSLDLPIGRLTRQDALQDQQVARHLKERLKAQLASIDAALRRIDNGTYGTCPICKQTIPEERLEMMPEIAACAPCRERRGR